MITDLKFPTLCEDQMNELTENTIILFNNTEIKNKFVRCIHDLIINKDTQMVDYGTIDDKDIVIKNFVSYLPTNIYKVYDEQTIIFSVEPTVLLLMKDKCDIWFVDEIAGKIEIYALTSFRGYGKDETVSAEEVYKNTCCGRFGCYEGYTGK